jgi:cytochrome b6-f complex iron-sulfur subunit
MIDQPKPPSNLKQKESATTLDQPMDRRFFIKWSVIGWTAFAAIIAGYGTIIMRYLFPNVLFEPKQSFRAGRPDEYNVGEVSERFKDLYGVWVVREPDKIYALATICTHLGCTPNWLANENKYKCPCHGSGFYKNGINFEGPAPRPLERYKIGISDEGEIVIDKTRKFQYENGEWNDPDSYLLV